TTRARSAISSVTPCASRRPAKKTPAKCPRATLCCYATSTTNSARKRTLDGANALPANACRESLSRKLPSLGASPCALTAVITRPPVQRLQGLKPAEIF
ncbi:hypothetical protein GGI05_001023, partial [Coemansia sp. RSA 2603]